MNFNRIFAVASTALAIAFATSCVYVDKSLGQDLIPSDQYLDMAVEKFDVPVELASADSIQAYGQSSVNLGCVVTDDFGKLNAAIAAEITPAVDSIIWGKEPRFVQMTASLTTSTAFCPSDDQKYIPQNIHFYQLNRPMDSTMLYSGQITEKDYNHTPIERNNVVYTGDGVIEVYFKEEFGKKLFDFTMEQLDSAEYFMNHFYGMYICVDGLEDGTKGGRINSVDLSTAYVYFTYSSVDENGERLTHTVDFALGQYYSLGVMEASSKHMETKTPEETIFAEGLTGIKPVIRGKDLRNMLDIWASSKGLDPKRILINRALLEFPFEYNGDRYSLDNYPADLFPSKRLKTKKDSQNLFYSPIDESGDVMFEAGAINRSLMCYRSDIGLYLQSLIRKDKSQINGSDDLWMMPVTSYSDSSTGETYYLTDCYSYYTARLNGTKAQRRPNLVLTYTYIL